MKQGLTPAERKFILDRDKRAALAEAETERQATLQKTAKLRALRLAKEAAAQAEKTIKPSRGNASSKTHGRDE